MDTGVLIVIIAGALLLIALASLGWLMLTDCCCMPVRRCCIRHCVRKVLKRADSQLEFEYNNVDMQLVLGRLPKSPAQLQELQEKAGVSALLTLNETWELPPFIAMGAIMEKGIISTRGSEASPVPNSSCPVCFIPTPDYCAPTQADIWRGVRWIQEQQDEGRTVYVHCNAGRGRSVVLVLCFLILSRDLSARQALQFVQEKRKVAVGPRCCGTRPQWRAVCKFERAIRRQAESVAGTRARLSNSPSVNARGNQVVPLPPTGEQFPSVSEP